MSNEANQLNLARKWRPKNFDSIIGQEVPIRMLKNSLFLKKFFPVYLFAGQRGCGKTSTARVFAAAINCQLLSQFQTDPTTSLPCLECPSCMAMARGNHPDFIEIDAASHTGVENVRQIIESSSYMPLNGQKKIYLIDEAHMLSKAAFNAFLKILEEPPLSVVFILATTEIHKIPSTVLSRCFQALFSSLDALSLKGHLQKVCSTEMVNIDDDALDILIQETEGCARDALNLLERVRFSGTHISSQTMLELLGKISTVFLFELFESVVQRNPQEVLQILVRHHFEQLSATALWDSVISLLRTLLWSHYKVQHNDPRFGADHQTLKALVEKCSLARLQGLMQILWDNEELFLKTHKKHIFFEMLLLQMCQENSPSRREKACPSSTATTQSTDALTLKKRENIAKIIPLTTQESPKALPTEQPEAQLEQLDTQAKRQNQDQAATPWKKFLEQLSLSTDPLLNSILAQANFITHNQDAWSVTLQLSNNGSFFKDKINESKTIWLPLLQTQFPGVTQFTFAASPQPTPSIRPTLTASPPLSKPPVSLGQKASMPTKPPYTPSKQHIEPIINIQDNEKWPFANLLVRYFPGKIKQTKVYS